MTNKEKYRIFCETEKNIPLFSQAWWLDSVAGDNWDVCLIEKGSGNEIVASMPYVTKKRLGFTLLTLPILTQNLGPWFKTMEVKSDTKLSQQKDWMNALIEQLPKYDYFEHSWHYSQTNWLPFYWRGFQETTCYTYVIDDIRDFEKVCSEFSAGKRKNIKKSEQHVKVVFDISAEDFYTNHKLTLAKQNSQISYDFDVFQKIYNAGYKNNKAKTIAAFDNEGNLHAALFVVWDEISAYNLISTIDPDYRTYGAAALLTREIIKYTSQFVNKFDFEGSMIEAVESSFRQFGAVQKPYFRIKKTASRTLNTMLHLKEALQR